MSNANSTNSSSKSSSVASKQKSSGFYPGYHAECKAAARATYIAQLDETVRQARLLVNELVSGEKAGYIAEYMIAAYYEQSTELGRASKVGFVEIRAKTIADLADYDVTLGFLRYVTNQVFSALKGAHIMAKYGEDFNSTLAAIKQRHERSEQKRHSQLVDA